MLGKRGGEGFLVCLFFIPSSLNLHSSARTLTEKNNRAQGPRNVQSSFFLKLQWFNKQTHGRPVWAASEIPAPLCKGPFSLLPLLTKPFVTFLESPCISHPPSSTLLPAFMQLVFRNASSAKGSALVYLYLARA